MERKKAQERVGDEVTRRREHFRLDQKDVAEMAGIDAKTVRALEKGARWPRAASRDKVEKVLRWPPGSLEAMRAEAEANSEWSTQLVSAAPMTSSGDDADAIAALKPPSRTVPAGKPIAFQVIMDLVDHAERVRLALDDIANGDSPEVVVSHAARLYTAAQRVAFEWAGGARGFGDLTETAPELVKDISRSSDTADVLLKKIRERRSSEMATPPPREAAARVLRRVQQTGAELLSNMPRTTE
ncbi:putative DNA-binding protein [Nocardia nova SH22a]|uniref:Putative DNA-binding protein n=1 Tax=Nocardia nova SH22a TaxID=1415166 RepID=W5TT34_9NOCA|nr:helix-turn-helix transcriptional regulator [Nocardia nova]AHH22078.1 putative DNA-binding protein [Nocardia nova SH22a]